MTRNMPQYDLGLNALGSFATGSSIANEIIQNRLRQQQLNQNYDIQDRQLALQEQAAIRQQQQRQAFQQLTVEAYRNPEEILPLLYSRDPQSAAKVSDDIQRKFRSQYDSINLLTNADAKDKQAVYDLVKNDLRREFPEIEFGDRYSMDMQKSLKNKASVIRTKLDKTLQFRDTAQGVVGFDPRTGESIQTGYQLKPSAVGVDSGGGATGALARQVMKDNPDMNFTQALQLVQTGFRTGTKINKDGSIEIIPGKTEAEFEKEKAITSGRKTGELATEKEFNAPRALSLVENTFAKNENVLSLIDNVIPSVNSLTSGFGGTVLTKIPGSPARDLQKQLDTIVANLGFDELQEMRNSSPTGGALGQVAVQEIKYLQSVKANLEKDQSPEQLIENLSRAKDQILASRERIRKVYEREYGGTEFGSREAMPDSMPEIKFLGFE